MSLPVRPPLLITSATRMPATPSSCLARTQYVLTREGWGGATTATPCRGAWGLQAGEVAPALAGQRLQAGFNLSRAPDPNSVTPCPSDGVRAAGLPFSLPFFAPSFPRPSRQHCLKIWPSSTDEKIAAQVSSCMSFFFSSSLILPSGDGQKKS